jgi:hypothetical protein
MQKGVMTSKIEVTAATLRSILGTQYRKHMKFSVNWWLIEKQAQ